MRLPGHIGRAFIRAMAQCCEENRVYGSGDHVRGELDATKKHLADMRKAFGKYIDVEMP